LLKNSHYKPSMRKKDSGRFRDDGQSPALFLHLEENMSQFQRQGLVKKALLTDVNLAEIEQLADICNRYENLHMRLSFVALRARMGTEYNDFLYYVDGKLVGYLSLDNWGSEEKEAVVMVHPDHRHKGIFHTLFAATREECLDRGIHRLVLVCEQGSASGQACAKAVGGKHTFSEHEMDLESFQEHYVFDENLFFREAHAKDLEALVAVQAASFSDPEPFVRAMLKKFLQDPWRHFYLATFGEGELSCQEPVGVIRLDEFEQGLIGIYAFGVVPDYRGRGYGRQILEETIRTVRATGDQRQIMLDVETDNVPAINLYKSCGFQIKTTYDYYMIYVHPA